METSNWKTSLIGLLGYMFVAMLIAWITPINFFSAFGVISMGAMITVAFHQWKDRNKNDATN